MAGWTLLTQGGYLAFVSTSDWCPTAIGTAPVGQKDSPSTETFKINEKQGKKNHRSSSKVGRKVEEKTLLLQPSWAQKENLIPWVCQQQLLQAAVERKLFVVLTRAMPQAFPAPIIDAVVSWA